jgi:predicted acylesterase/phospholipase RssA
VSPGGAGDEPFTELRLAVAFTGGVSLAVWMGGIAREMNLLLAASRAGPGEQVVGSISPESQQVRDGYQRLLQLLKTECTLDVLSGTSAGGVNAAVLGLANAQGFDLGGLRDLWFTHGSLAKLLRNPSEKQPPSLLDGDNGLFEGLNAGFDNLSKYAPRATPGGPTEVFITTTLLTGEASRFTDEYGTLVRDTDHHGLFRFADDALAQNVPALAFAARCSASYPGAFEPALISIGKPDGRHPDMKPFATNISTTQFAADGGLLANRPLGPALQAVFDRTSDREVRRVLAYVVPTVAGSPQSEPAARDAAPPHPPSLAAAVLTDLKAMTSQSISAELSAITAHNEQVRARRDARQELARLGTVLDQVAEQLYHTYRARRAEHLARAVAKPALAQLTAAKPTSGGQPRGFGDADRVVRAARDTVLGSLPPQLPATHGEMTKAGREALDDAKATVLALLNGSYQLVSADDRQRLGPLKQLTSEIMPPRAVRGMNDAVVGTPAAAKEAAIKAAEAALNADMEVKPEHPRPWHELGDVVIKIHRLLPAPGDDFVASLLAYLTADGSEASADRVALRLFRLHMARYVLQPDGLVADQELELVQMSADSRTMLDPRTLAAKKLTGLQLHHFGAFYKCSWRANDWMWGRLDGAGWLVHVLLDPRRLRALAEADPAFQQKLEEGLRAIAASGLPPGVAEEPPPGVWVPFPPQNGEAGAAAEMAFLTNATLPTPTSLPVTAMWVASGLQRHIAAEELAHVAEQAVADSKSGHYEKSAQRFVATYRTMTGGGNDGSYPAVPVDKAKQVLQACKVSDETLAQEAGTPMLTRGITQAAAVAVSAVNQGRAARSFLRPTLAGAHTATMLAFNAAKVGTVARYPMLAGLGLAATGALASTSTLSVISAAGLGAVLAGMLLVAAGAVRWIGPVIAAIALVAGAALAAGGFIPVVRDHLFPWLGKTAVPGLAKHPVLWAIVVAFLLLPPVWTIARLLLLIINGVMRRLMASKLVSPVRRTIANWRQRHGRRGAMTLPPATAPDQLAEQGGPATGA